MNRLPGRPRQLLGRVARSPLLRPWRLRGAFGEGRMEPAFLLIGAQKAGTTSLFRYLLDHPRVAPPLHKEIHYFDLNFHKGRWWYRAHFPPRDTAGSQGARGGEGGGRVTGEASPYYLFHPLAAGRIQECLPGVKLLALLRDPVVRAYSHYRHSVRLGYEPLSFEEALAAEEDRLAGEEEALAAEPLHRSFPHQHFSYQARGRYAQQLARYARYVPSDRMLILTSEAFFAEPGPTLRRVLDFLDLEPWAPPSFPVHNPGREVGGAHADTFQRLRTAFEPWNHALAEDFGVDVGPW